MRASSPRDETTHCPVCFFRREICVCPILPVVSAKTEIWILRHVREAVRPANTGRLVALAMPGARVVSCGGGERIGGGRRVFETLPLTGTWLLWPDGPGLPADPLRCDAPLRIAVIDATWHQARRLYRQTPCLHQLPKLALPAPETSRQRLRKQRRPDGMSTIEAVAAALSLLEGKASARPLEILYDEVVRRSRALRWGERKS